MVVENVVETDEDDKTAMTPERQAKLDAYLAATPKDREEKKLAEGVGKATTFWAVFEKERKEYDQATEAERKEKKLKDPRFLSTFVVKESRPGEIVGDAKTPLAPFWIFFLLMFVHCIFYVPTVSITNSIAFANLKDPGAANSARCGCGGPSAGSSRRGPSSSSW